MELGQVFLEHFGCIARGVAGNHDGNENIAALLLDLLVHQSHLVELVGADVRAVREAEVDLTCCQSSVGFSRGFLPTYQRISAQQVLVRELLPIVINKIEWASNLGLAHALGLVRYPLPCHSLFFVCEVRVQSASRCYEENRRRQVERLFTWSAKLFPLAILDRHFPKGEQNQICWTCVPHPCYVRALARSS